MRVVVPNRPGVVADLALALGRAGINIHDMSLSPSPDNRAGEVALWVAGEEHAAARPELVAELGSRSRGMSTDALRAGHAAARGADAAPPTSRSRTARRSSARWPPSRCGCATSCTRHDTLSTLAAMQQLGALVEVATPDELVIRGVGPARRARRPTRRSTSATPAR